MAPCIKLVSVMSNMARGIVDRTSKFFPIALAVFGLIATILWTSTVMTFALARIWSVVPGVG